VLAGLLGCTALALLPGCKNRRGSTGELEPPGNAVEWESRYGVAFDDDYTRHKLNLKGRAPNDVLDQRLFQSRLGHANYVALARVEQVWGKGRNQGKQDQFLDIELGEVLMGDVNKEADSRQLLRLRTEDELPGSLRGQIMIFFLRWAPGERPAFHHHLMPADPDTVSLIRAMVAHAREAGVLTRGGRENVRGKAKRRRQERRERKEAEASSQATTSTP
jgi:hypothetical protein